jgi:hypothetical protein
MEVKVEKDVLVIRIPIRKDPKPSASGKTIVLASSSGNVKTGVKYKDKEIVIGLNAYYKSE